MTTRLRGRLGEALLVSVLLADIAFGIGVIVAMRANVTRDLLLSAVLANAMTLLFLRRRFVVCLARNARSAAS